MLEAVYRPRAAHDLESALVYLGEVQKAPQAARDLYSEIEAAIDLLCETPEIGRRFTDSALAHDDYRSWLVGNYRIFYSHDSELLTIWRIIHTQQDRDDYSIIDV